MKRYNNSLDFYINKYGDSKGKELYNDLLQRRIVKICRASKESFRFFKNIYIYLRNKGIRKNDIYWGVGHSNEWFINSNFMILQFLV